MSSEGGMHGRKRQAKVAGQSEEVLAKARAKEQEGIREFLRLTQAAHEKRSSKEYDEQAFGITTTILDSSPDFYTIWNIRREILNHWLGPMTEEEQQDIMNKELQFSDLSIRKAPKSYWVWNHRGWILSHHPRPDWGRELKLVTMMLDIDARNFHGWDYRRHVVASGNFPALSEFDFTTKKINQNFSNFSAWQYRAKVIPRAFPDLAERQKIIEKDFDMVRNAIFTEPADQSAWLYQRWLLGEDKQQPQITSVHGKLDPDGNLILALFLDKEIWVKNSECIQVYAGDGILSTHSATKRGYVTVVHTQLALGGEPALSPLKVVVDHGIFQGSRTGAETSQSVFKIDRIQDVLAESAVQLRLEQSGVAQEASPVNEIFQSVETWKRELEAIQELVEVEPDSKWALLTVVHIMKRLGCHDQQAIQHLDHLAKIDPARKEYYRDYKSHFIANSVSKDKYDPVTRAMSLGGLGLTTLCPAMGIQDSIQTLQLDVSANSLRSLDGLHRFPFAKSVRAARNGIRSIEGVVDLLELEELDLSFNEIRTVDGLDPLSQCRRLSSLHLRGNPIVDAVGHDALKRELKARIPHLARLDDEAL
ncbi:uncharacterized protein BJ171DRAFT_455956 [Polychytrium aggregatum]|uniref:uncharacterized protein n=1 Tax=Polychytrium aggregatum TaxID=110093 RepID=UPI0022FEEDCB|nr:uncharacterized protein BJ171DRAFT_455956 [Polychytrium aggregatum]KAI9207979.1 hypothetical protein BJ171DRAFT_455956 [Polychytrium aggregatum]